MIGHPALARTAVLKLQVVRPAVSTGAPAYALSLNTQATCSRYWLMFQLVFFIMTSTAIKQTGIARRPDRESC